MPSTGTPGPRLGWGCCSSRSPHARRSSDSRSDDDNSPGSGDGDTEANAPVDDGPRTYVTSAAGGLTLETTSTRAAMVSNGDVLVTVFGDAAADAVLTSDGTDVSDVLVAEGDVRRGVVSGLTAGEHTLEVTAGDESVSLEVTSHPKNGPVFSGPHLEPWVCTTEPAGLGPAIDADCDAPSKTT